MILNEIPVKTTNNFNINDLKIDLIVPTNLEYRKFITKNIEDIDIKYSEIENITSKIGLDLPKALNIDITIDKKIVKPIELIYEFKENDNLIDNININCKSGSSANIIIKYISSGTNTNFHHLKQLINLENDSNLTITVLNLLNSKSINLIASESTIENNSTLTQNLFDIGSDIKISNYYSNVLENANSYLNNIYIGKDNNIIDMNYNYINKQKKSVTNLVTEGILDNKSTKKYRGTIDFISGASKSIGKEKENCVLLSDTAISRSVPILLCGEEDVEGAHAVSTGKLEDSKLFYIKSRGIDEKQAKKMIIMSNFNKIVEEINNKETEEEVIEILDSIL